MATHLTLFITLLAYSFIVSQSFMYILALKTVQLNLSGKTYTEFRHLIDGKMRRTFRYPIYVALLANPVLVILTMQDPGSLLLITACISLIALIAEVLLTVKGNLPINDVINQWSPDQYPANWTEYRKRWLDIFHYRQVANISGFISLLIGAVFQHGF